MLRLKDFLPVDLLSATAMTYLTSRDVAVRIPFARLSECLETAAESDEATSTRRGTPFFEEPSSSDSEAEEDMMDDDGEDLNDDEDPNDDKDPDHDED